MPKIVDREAMQDQILEAAFRAFVEVGFHATRMTDIAREAGLAKGTLYLYFKSKDELAIALIRRRFSEFAQGAPEPRCNSLADFIEVVRAGMVQAMSDPGATRLFFDLLGPGFANDAVRREIGGFFDRLGDRYARQLAELGQKGLVREDIDAAATGAALAMMLDGLVMHRALFGHDDAQCIERLDVALGVIATGLVVENSGD